jgi:hypothetical protein
LAISDFRFAIENQNRVDALELNIRIQPDEMQGVSTAIAIRKSKIIKV